ncbi:MAG: MFS transporter [Candidatus Cohnella colombiensis]|uniref:MFS transporter n=1 Tax=Candidatus Cohnella colombiensis TaxID=3121368 RepID=A0AA95EUX2_9BACL|nr:MAG: MFS transporter [Cohnella sp.]
MLDNKKVVRSWMMYDWANSAFATTIMAAVLPIYYVSAVGGTDTSWGFTQTASAIVIALLSPLLGAIADYSNRKIFFLRWFMILGAISSMLLVLPGKGDVLLTSIIVIIGMVGFGAGNTFYDALLNDVASPGNRDKVSANGFALGYLGGGILLALNIAIIQNPSLIGLKDTVAASQVSFFSVGVWWIIFSIPILRNVREKKTVTDVKLGQQVIAGLQRLRATFMQIRKYPELWKFMIAYWFFFDGVNTIIVMAASYGTTIGIESGDLIKALLITQFIGFPASYLFGSLAKRLGAKKMLYAAQAVYLVIVVLGYFMETALHFYILAALVGLVQGGSQATARSIYSRLIPAGRVAEFNGFLSFTSRFFSFGGPLVFALVKLVTDSSRSALLAVAFFFVMGMIVLTFVDTVKGERESERAME